MRDSIVTLSLACTMTGKPTLVVTSLIHLWKWAGVPRQPPSPGKTVPDDAGIVTMRAVTPISREMTLNSEIKAKPPGVQH